MAYRDGYCDGFLVAVDTMYELLSKRIGKDRAYNICEEFYNDALCEWRRGDCSKKELPPDIRKE
jgi:hypothetical protein